jgi:hypothetical protein
MYETMLSSFLGLNVLMLGWLALEIRSLRREYRCIRDTLIAKGILEVK